MADSCVLLHGAAPVSARNSFRLMSNEQAAGGSSAGAANCSGQLAAFRREDQMTVTHGDRSRTNGSRSASFGRSVSSAALLFAIAGSPMALAQDTDNARDRGPGCAHNRPAIAHHAGGTVVKADESAPIPCATATGWRTSEPSIVLTNLGGVLLQPAFDKAGLPMGLI